MVPEIDQNLLTFLKVDLLLDSTSNYSAILQFYKEVRAYWHYLLDITCESI